MVLRAGYIAVALRLQEAADHPSSEARSKLTEKLNKAAKVAGKWASYVSHTDTELIYSSEAGLQKVPYSSNELDIDLSKSAAVYPITTFAEVGARNSRSDLTQIQTIHDSATILGANCSLAESDRLETSSDVFKDVPHGTLALVESWDWKEQALQLVEASGPAVMKIKLISPGKGSSAFYPAEVLKRDGPNVFTKGTHIYINHATDAEQSTRPEGDWHKLAGALNGNAYWDESAKQGPGLYGDALFTSDYAPLIKEKAPFTGMSIRANGHAQMEDKKPVLKEGVPVLAKLTSAESVDVVTRAGAGGLILTEAALPQSKEAAMTAEEITKLVESAVKSAVAEATKPVPELQQRALRGDAYVEAGRTLKGLALAEASKQRVIETVLERSLPIKEGQLDLDKFAEAVNAEAKREGAYIAQFSGSGVRGMGIVAAESDPVKLQQAKDRKKAEVTELRESAENVFGRLMKNPNAAKAAASRGAA